MRELDQEEVEQVSGGAVPLAGVGIAGPIAVAFGMGYGAGTLMYTTYTAVNGTSLGTDLYQVQHS